MARALDPQAQLINLTVSDVTGDELDYITDPTVPVETLLFRLFHERGVRVYRAAEIRDECSCSRQRVAGLLRTFTAQEIAESTENGAISVTCEFCSKRYRFDPADFARDTQH